MRSKPVRRVMVSKRSRRSVSRLTVTRMSPAALRSAANSARCRPLVVRARSSGPSAGQQADERDDAAPRQRLAARQPEAPDARGHGRAGDRGDLLVAQHVGHGDERHARFGHAVDAAQVAAVRDRDAEDLTVSQSLSPGRTVPPLRTSQKMPRTGMMQSPVR